MDNYERDELFVKLIKTHTLNEIGLMFGISRERVRQILFKMGVKNITKRIFKYPCDNCQKIVIRHKRKGNGKILCTTCYSQKRRGGPKYFTYKPGDLCIRCKKRRPKSKWLCKVCRVWDYAQRNPEYRQRQREQSKKYIREYLRDPEYRKRKNDRLRRKYATEPEYRKHVQELHHNYYVRRKFKKILLENQTV